MTFNLVWLPARQTGSSTRTKVLLRIMLRDTTACEDDLVKQALRYLEGLNTDAANIEHAVVADVRQAKPDQSFFILTNVPTVFRR